MKILLSILTLGSSIWALPALATPSHPIANRGEAADSAPKSARAAAVELRLGAKDVASVYDHPKTAGARYDLAQDQGPGQGPWSVPTKLADVGSPVPEPYSITLFGVGLLVALQAIPRRRSGESPILAAEGAAAQV
jgi:hypothetical protein